MKRHLIDAIQAIAVGALFTCVLIWTYEANAAGVW